MVSTAVQFGAGNVGRGFVAQLFWESGMEVVFVEVNTTIVELLNARRSYPLCLIPIPGVADSPKNKAENPTVVQIAPVRALHTSQQHEIALEIAQASVLCTAVGAAALQHIAPLIALGLLKRYELHHPPLNILLCENLYRADSVLREAVSQHLPEALRESILQRTGFVPTVVSRMIPIPSPEERAADPLFIRAESYHRLPADKHAVVGTLPPISGLELVDNFHAHMERKLYSHNAAHAALGYLGWLKGYTYAADALKDATILARIKGLMDETGMALVKQHGFDLSEQRAYEEELLRRIANPELGDTCDRLARDPLRKLAPEDRLVGAARLCLRQQIFPDNAAYAIAAALHYAHPDDVSARALQERIGKEGIEAFLAAHCHIASTEPLGETILRYYFLLKEAAVHGL
ncbi:MAG TPA: hypothetical protein VKV29_03660 [Chthonomonas sp.]|jgi:mannitol-1-phosphate 5-dehydrogenase|uniref:mannitol dehydrogenase family protein n=1 Tax=Chthonomonas sp. TaxID=2282153 RepID=UPI002B4B417C|nr:hypothetical protein [Chthonomonas sp.]HLH79360.1 hypothetical protein [Chthonomonas sp.]